jgi:endo-1,4-beta-D-glucanase Y
MKMINKMKWVTFLCICNFLFVQSWTMAQNKPFPQAMNFTGCIKPTNVTQAQMDALIKSLYDSYKSKYLKQCPDQTDQYYMYAEGNPSSSADATVSEQHGYAMITMALMAGYDVNAKKYYDGMYKLYSRFRSTVNNNFMSWKITKSGSVMKGGEDAATDGDMDIAYSLLLANDQWGGGPDGTSVTYLGEAKRIINALHGTKGEVSNTTYRTILGDAFTNQLNTRSSDWMIDHMRAYKTATDDAFWTNVENEVYNCITDLTGTGKPGASTGLVPDFAKSDPAVPDAAGGGTGEDNADKYGWNGCRYPWRIAMGFQHYGSTQAKAAITKILDWATGSPTGGDPKTFNGGYNLNGTKIGSDQGELAFVAPITLAAVVDPKYQAFLNKGWGELSGLSGDSYNDAIGLLCMLSIAGDWWIPGNIAPQLTNLALVKPVTASSEPQPENPASAAVDGSTDTRWSASAYPQWIEVDLGAVYSISRTDLICYGDRAYQFKVEAKTTASGTYALVVDRTANTTPGTIASPVSDNFGAVDARFVRLTVSGCSGYTGTWISISEFRVFGGTLKSKQEVISPSVAKAVSEPRLMNFPNPFSNHTEISYTMEKDSKVMLMLSDINGATRKILVNSLQNAGSHTLPCDFSDLAEGIYLLTLKTDDQLKTLKMICVK